MPANPAQTRNRLFRSRHPTPKPIPSSRKIALARAYRAWLLFELGGRCVDCGTSEALEFDHLVPRSWQPREHNQLTRMRYYIRDYHKGHLCIRCQVCNGKKGYPAGQLELLAARSETPF